MDKAKLIDQIAEYIQSSSDGRWLISKIQDLHVPVKLNVLKWFDIHMCPLYDFIDYFLQCLEEEIDSHIIACGPDYVARSLMRFWGFILCMDEIATLVFDINNLLLGGFKFQIAQDNVYNKRFYLILNGSGSEAGFKLHLENMDSYGRYDIKDMDIYFHLDGNVFCKHTLNDHDNLFEFPITLSAQTETDNDVSLRDRGSETFMISKLKKSDIIKYLNNLF